MNCLIFMDDEIQPDGTVVIREAKARHVGDVLKKKPGDTILAGRLNGVIGPAAILQALPDCMILEQPRGHVPPRSRIKLILAMPRPKVMKRLWSPLASIGVDHITMIGAEKVEPFYFESHALQPAIYVSRMIEGLEQARCTCLPRVAVHRTFKAFATAYEAAPDLSARRLVAHPGAATRLREALIGANATSPVLLAIGPEGGWSENERSWFSGAGFLAVGLGDRTLRTDVAVISLLAVIQELAREDRPSDGLNVSLQ